MDLSLDSGKVAPVQLAASSTIFAKFPYSDPRLPMLQIAKEWYFHVQLTELYKMRPEPKEGRTLTIIRSEFLEEQGNSLCH